MAKTSKTSCKPSSKPYSKWDHWFIDKEHHTLVEFAAQAPSPCKDFVHIHVSPNEFVYRLWKIIPPTRSDYFNHPPSEVRDSWEDFIHDDFLHGEICRTTGSKTTDYLLNVAHGHLDFLPRLPSKLLVRIISMLDLEDIRTLTQVNRFFSEFCNSDELWEPIYRMNSATQVTEDVKKLGDEVGWKNLFFTNKLQLQMHLRRQKQPQQKQNVFLTQK